MATLTRPQATTRVVAAETGPTENVLLTSTVPAPFPRERLIDVDDEQVPEIVQPSTSTSTRTSAAEIVPSIGFVQRSCLMTLNNLLSVPTNWNPIVPDRRHSMPNAPRAASTSSAEPDSSASALQTLVANLRTREIGDEMIEIASSEGDLVRELSVRVDHLSTTLSSEDARLAKSLVSLLSHLDRLSLLHAPHQADLPVALLAAPSSASDNIFDTLERQLSDLQTGRRRNVLPPGSPPVLAVESALLWSRIDAELESVVTMCKERTSLDHLPPQYDRADYDEFDSPPDYEYDTKDAPSDVKEPTPSIFGSASTSAGMNEKMRLDFEAVTMAIDRLYLVAPQLHNQRVELKSSKLAQMERARREGSQSASPKGKQKQDPERDLKDLDHILEMISKASERRLDDQSVILEGGMGSRMERARLREEARRQAFVDQLAEHSAAGRLHSQDAVFRPPRVKDPNTMLSLPEFMRESVPPHMRQVNPETLMSLPEFVREVQPPSPPSPQPEMSTPVPQTPAVSGTLRRLTGRTTRDRSNSAPSPFSWLRSSASRSNLRESPSPKGSAKESSTPGSPNAIELDVSYIAEHHESLHHILVFLTVTGAMPGVDVAVEVLPRLGNTPSGSHIVVKAGSQSSQPFALPREVATGKAEVRSQNGHFEVKLATTPSSTSTSVQHTPLLDAIQFGDMHPTSFICSSCSLPIVQSSRISQFRDLPSEHWQELVDAWMCHADQKLHEDVKKNSKGFWPKPGEALVGGSYVLFEDSVITKSNLHPATVKKRGDDWYPVTCICGATVGRRQAGPTVDASPVYRLLKYAIRPVSPSSDPIKLPLSAFIVEDMVEFVNAHASYRFVVLDEEDDKPRILMWLFKPSLNIAYVAKRAHVLPKAANIQAAKVLYKLVGPGEDTTDLQVLLNRYPGFPQAEYLHYPMNVCRRMAALLKESNRTYPESMRTMTGLEVGWLRRS